MRTTKIHFVPTQIPAGMKQTDLTLMIRLEVSISPNPMQIISGQSEWFVDIQAFQYQGL